MTARLSLFITFMPTRLLGSSQLPKTPPAADSPDPRETLVHKDLRSPRYVFRPFQGRFTVQRFRDQAGGSANHPNRCTGWADRPDRSAFSGSE
jgi:hypothetical protein